MEYKTVDHARKAIKKSKLMNWRWGDRDSEAVNRCLAAWLFTNNKRLNEASLKTFIESVLGDDSKAYKIEGGKDGGF